MRIIALDTSTSRGSIAISTDGRVVALYGIDSRSTHTERVFTSLDYILRETDTDLKDAGLLAFANGPGSFTGLRIGLSVLKGLSLSLNIPIAPVNTLEALSRKVLFPDRLVVPVMDAKRGEVYAAAFADNKRIFQDMCVTPEELVSRVKKEGKETVFVGDGIFVYRDILSREGECFEPADLFLASEIALIAADMASMNRIMTGSDATLNYVRPSDAEIKSSR